MMLPPVQDWPRSLPHRSATATNTQCDLNALAQTSVELLLAAINGDPSREVRLAVQLVERSTHAGPPD
jgi:DNA-binding LacI/PurR family transcriptional regulator